MKAEFPSLRVSHRPPRPALLDEKVQRRFVCAPNLSFLGGEAAVAIPGGAFGSLRCVFSECLFLCWERAELCCIGGAKLDFNAALYE